MPPVPLGATCSKCHTQAKRTYNCDHTDYQEYCKECYTELHYYLTEPDGGADAAAAAVVATTGADEP